MPPNARLTSEIEATRCDLAGGDGESLPVVGDLIFVDQAFTGPSGMNEYLVYCQNADGSVRWTADLFDTEFESLKY